MEDDLVSVFASRLREIRAQRGLTQAVLGERAQVAPAEISKFENRRRVPTLETIGRLAKALSVQGWELLRDEQSELEQLAAVPEHVRLEELLRGQPPDVKRRAVAIIEVLVSS